MSIMFWPNSHRIPCPPPPSGPNVFSQLVHGHFMRWADSIGLVPSFQYLPYLQMGSNVVWQTMPFLGGCVRALFLLQQSHVAPTPSLMPYDMPIWHNTIFRNQHRQSYFCPKLIRDGVHTWGAFLEDDSSQDHIAPTWKLICNVTKPGPQEGDACFLNPEFWASWNKATVGACLSYPTNLKNRQSQEVWAKFCSSDMPSHVRDFVRKALWKKLPMGKRLSSWIPNALHCPLDGAEETIEHSLTTCRFLPFAFDTISKCFLPVSINDTVVNTLQELFRNF